MMLPLPDILQRLEEYREKIVYEVDFDFQEMEELNAAILSHEDSITPEIAADLKKNIDEISSFVDHQKQAYRKILNGVSTGKKAIGQYKSPKLQTQSVFVYRRA